ncbi:mycothiol acetyltransferase [Kocuria varians]|uniref:Mycothiol acetyltransferase n=1 Tax=Kocuria varians TaxID=1272 RepID=A0A4Y4D2S9_KOCVA|nr:mycothiol synthase [Kocuria varians]GEC98044.1 mycothiol acetyltransferase [Kocuria varians]
MAVTVTPYENVPDPEALVALAQRAEQADGEPPFSDQTVVDIRSGRAGVTAVTATDGESLVGAAVVVPQPDAASTFTVELVVDPEHRNRGVATAIGGQLRAMVDGTVEAWAHGNTPAAQRLAELYSLTPVRDLYRYKRSVKGAQDVPLDVSLPDGVTIRAFEVGRDEQAWLRINSQAFAQHPEQGRLSLSDLQERENAPWFDPAGFLLAVSSEDPDTVLGFHWTKVHPAVGETPEMGEVYAVGVAPEQQGSGLGRALTAAGINHLAEQGLGEVMLYVDAENTAAVALYESLGFERWHTDVMYRS